MENFILILALIFFILILAHYFAALYALRKMKKHPKAQDYQPGVSAIKPVKGLDENARENFRSFLLQEYGGPYQIIFSLQDDNDPALPLLYELKEEFAHLDIKILVNPVRQGLTGKGSNLYYGVESADYPIIIFSDADVCVHKNFIANIISPLKHKRIGLTSALTFHTRAKGFWALLYQLKINTTLIATWLPYATIFKVGVSGGTVAIKREVLDRIGGVESFGCYLVEDVKLGLLVNEAGYRIKIMESIVSPVGRKSYHDLMGFLGRGAVIYRKMLPNYLEAPYIAGVYFYLLPLFLYIPTGSGAYLAAFLLHLFGKMLTGFLVSRRAGTTGVEALFVIIMDALFLSTYILLLRKGTLAWRGIEYEVDSAGKIE